MSDFLDPALFDDFKLSRVTIYRDGGTTSDPRGARVSGAPTAILTDIPCQLEPVDRGASENQSVAGAIADSLFDVILDQVYDQITEKHWAQIDGKRYNIVRVSTDPANTVTTLRTTLKTG